MRYFIGNWKMFGLPKSISILNKINSFVKIDKNSKKYRVIITPPYTLLESFSKSYKNKKIDIGAQNSYHKDMFSSNTGAISSYMIKKLGSKYIIIGHSDNRSEGDSDSILKKKVSIALKNNLKVIFCIGENKSQKKNNKTFSVLKKQLTEVLEKKFNKDKIIVAYEPIWSIGTGKIPNQRDLLKTTVHIKKILKSTFKKKSPAVLYGGSVDETNVHMFKQIKEIDGFLIGGASKSSKKFIDIIKNYYR
jgi:triosephosphate isomerase